MTMYDDSRVVTLLREIDPPLAPPDRLGAVTRRARRAESRRATVLAGVMAVVLGAGVVTAVNVGGGNRTEQLSVAQAAGTTTAAGTARFSMRMTMTGGPVATAQGVRYDLSGPVDFVHQRYSLTGDFGGQKYELRVIGSDVWTKASQGFPGKPWLHVSELSKADAALTAADPDHWLTTLQAQGTQLSRTQKGDRTVTVLRVPASVFGQSSSLVGGAASFDVTVEVDGDGRIRKAAYTHETPVPGSEPVLLSVQVRYDDFGIDVHVEPPPADQVGEVSDLLGKQFGEVSKSFQGLSGPDGCKLLDTQVKQFLDRAPPEQRATFEKLFADARKACAEAQRSATASPHP